MGENFSLISLLAGINHETLEFLSAAVLSGDVKNPCQESLSVSIFVSDPGSFEDSLGKLQDNLSEDGPVGRIRRGVVYE